MEKVLFITVLTSLFLFGCKTTKTVANTKKNNKEIIKIEDDKDTYDIIIIDTGFNRFLATEPPKSFYSKSMLEAKNRRYVQIWNERVHNPQHYNPNIYEQEINYDTNTHYGLDVNYKLYQYFQYLEKVLGERFY